MDYLIVIYGSDYVKTLYFNTMLTIKRLHDDKERLGKELEHIHAFIASEAYQILPLGQRTLLIVMSKAMETYYQCLLALIVIIDPKN